MKAVILRSLLYIYGRLYGNLQKFLFSECTLFLPCDCHSSHQEMVCTSHLEPGLRHVICFVQSDISRSLKGACALSLAAPGILRPYVTWPKLACLRIRERKENNQSHPADLQPANCQAVSEATLDHPVTSQLTIDTYKSNRCKLSQPRPEELPTDPHKHKLKKMVIVFSH